MVKKASQSSLKISKNEKKQQLNSLIEVLRPKVYITDSSNFKRLVQELTGNGKGSTITSPPPSKPEAIEKTPVIEIEDHALPESIMQELSVDSLDSSNQAPFINESNQAWDQVYFDETALKSSSMNQLESDQIWDQINFDETALESSWTTKQHEDLLQYQDFESWLLDMEQFPSCSFPQIEQQVFELSGLL